MEDRRSNNCEEQDGQIVPNNCPRISTSQLLGDLELTVRSRVDPLTVKRYENIYRNEKDSPNTGRKLPPITVARMRGAVVVVDGLHRLEAMRRAGVEPDVLRWVDASENTIRWLSAKANLEHGKPLNGPEIRKAFRAYICARKHIRRGGGETGADALKSYREITAELGGTRRHTSIRNWMWKDFPKIAKRMGGGDEGLDPEKGGCWDRPSMFAEVGRRAAGDALAAFRGTSRAEDQTVIVEAMERSLAVMTRALTSRSRKRGVQAQASAPSDF